MFISSSLNGITELSNDIVLMVFLALFAVVSVVTAVWAIAANINKPDKSTVGRLNAMGVVWIILAVGLVVRVAFSLLTIGYIGLNSTSPSNNTNGLMGLYNFLSETMAIGVQDISQYPVHGYIQLLLAKILDVFGGFDAEGNIVMRLFMRLPYMLADLAAAAVLYRIAKKYANTQVAISIAAIYALCPVFFFASGIWGSAASLVSLFLILTLYFMTQKKFLHLTIVYGVALLTAVEAVFFLPIVGFFYIYSLIVAVKAYLKAPEARGFSIKKLFMDKEHGLILRIPVYIVASLVGMYLISMPMLKSVNFSPVEWFATIYVRPFSSIGFFSNNSFSVYNLFSRLNAELGNGVPVWLISAGFMLIAVALVYVLYTSKKNRANLVVIAAYVMVTLSIYHMGFNEMTLLPVLGCLLLSFILIKDKRILQVFAALAVLIVVNGAGVMASAGYFSSGAITELYDSTGSALMSASMFGKVITITCSALAMIVHVYFTMIILDITMANRRLLFATQNDSFGESMKSWFARGRKL